MKSIISFIITLLMTITPLHITADSWRVLFYMDASDNLKDMAFKALNEMMQAKPKNNIELFVQIHAQNNIGLRYQINNKGLKAHTAATLTRNAYQDFIDAATWGFSNNKATHSMIIFNNHGFGVLEPRWNSETNKWEVVDDQTVRCTLEEREHHITRHRGYMFNDASHTYLSNKDIALALNIIKTTLLNDQLIDIIALDTCMGAMIEVASEIDAARYLIGSQTCALIDGFDYIGIIELLNKKQNQPKDVAIGMVDVFDNYYKVHDKKGIYTHAAIDLTIMPQLQVACKNIITPLLTMPLGISALLRDVRKQAPRFCLWPFYTDIVSFFQLLYRQLSPLASAPAVAKTRNAINEFTTLYQTAIIAHCEGERTKQRAHGLAIYCPFNYIDSSYLTSSFAINSGWLDLLKLICTVAPEEAIGWSVYSNGIGSF